VSADAEGRAPGDRFLLRFAPESWGSAEKFASECVHQGQ
jgi:hypothetical protein